MTRLHIDIDRETHPATAHATVRVRGELDMHTAAQLRSTLVELASTRPGTDIVLDVGELSFADSSGLSALIAAHKRTEAVGGTLRIRRPSERLGRMLAITGLDRVLRVLPNESHDSEPRKGLSMINFNTVREGDHVVLQVSGEVDLDHADELRDAVLAAFDEQPAAVRVDLAGVSFLNSSGLSALLAGVEEAEHRGIDFAVCNEQPQVRRLMELVGLAEVLGGPAAPQ